MNPEGFGGVCGAEHSLEQVIGLPAQRMAWYVSGHRKGLRKAILAGWVMYWACGEADYTYCGAGRGIKQTNMFMSEFSQGSLGGFHAKLLHTKQWYPTPQLLLELKEVLL